MHNPAVATQNLNKCPRCGTSYINHTQRDHAGNVTVTKDVSGMRLQQIGGVQTERLEQIAQSF